MAAAFDNKKAVHDFWNESSCGEQMLLPSKDRAGFVSQMASRYKLEPYIIDFADFNGSNGKFVLELSLIHI